jgi:ATP-dependent helicase/nuclease subunit B
VGGLQVEDAETLGALLEEGEGPPVAPSTAAAMRAVREALGELEGTALPEAVDTFGGILEELGVPGAVEAARSANSGSDRGAAGREAVALEELRSVLGALVEVDRAAETPPQGEPIERMERAIRMKRVDAGPGRDEGAVEIRRLMDGGTSRYRRVYVLGLSDSQFPSNPHRLAFTQAINRSHRDFEQADRQRRARYNLAVKLLSAEEVVLSRPRRESGGDELTDAGFLSELRRVGLVEGTEPPARLRDRRDSPGSDEDLRRTLVDALSVPTATPDLVDGVGDALEGVRGVTAAAPHVRRGLLCAAHRSEPNLTRHDAHLGPGTAAALHDRDDRQPYSASRLESYANCGFVYYMQEALELDVDEGLELDPHPGEKGWFVHDVLYRFFDGLQDGAGEAVDLRDLGREELEERLCRAALEEAEASFESGGSAFHVRWLQSLLAGLATLEVNPHHAREIPHSGVEQGLLSRFLDAELELAGEDGPLPAWFEARIGPSRSDHETQLLESGVEVEAPSGRATTVRGMVDRIDAGPAADPIDLVVRDYKTGSPRYRSRTIRGLEFQLPVYAMLADAAVGERTDAATRLLEAAYYQLPTDGTPTPSSTGIDADYFDDGVEGLERFVWGLTAERLADIEDSIAEGIFHPTLRTSWGAGCDRCEYRDVCDVRHHQRQDRVEALETGPTGAYVPDDVRPGEFDLEERLDSVGGDR